VTDLRELLRQPVGAREENRLKILRSIMAAPSNQADLVRRSGMSSATVSNVVGELEREGIVRTERRAPNTIVTMEPTTGVAVGVELGFQNTAVIARQVHQPIAEARAKTVQVGGNSGVRRWLEAVVGLICDVASEVGNGPEDLVTIGLGIPRVVDPRTQQLTPPLLPPWEDVADPAGQITQRLRDISRDNGYDLPDALQVRVNNDAALGALAESTYTYPRKETLVYIKSSTGVGAGIVISGRVFRGRRGVAGEIGHTMVDRGGGFCLCGGRGCLETIIGSSKLLEHVAILDRPPKTMDELADRARQGNALCGRVLREAAGRLGRAIGDLCNVLNPDIVVLGGAMGRAATIVLEPCRAGISESAVAAAHEDEFELVASTVEHATAHGAWLLGIEGTLYPPLPT
jgi:predicted NBD/HSP70 family sugar kinase